MVEELYKTRCLNGSFFLLAFRLPCNCSFSYLRQGDWQEWRLQLFHPIRSSIRQETLLVTLKRRLTANEALHSMMVEVLPNY